MRGVGTGWMNGWMACSSRGLLYYSAVLVIV